MMNLIKPISRCFAAAAIALCLSANGKSAARDSAPAAHLLNYERIDTDALEKTLLKQMDDAGVARPKVFRPFPTEKYGPEGYYEPKNQEVHGLSSRGEFFNFFKTDIYSLEKTCDNYFLKHFDAMRVSSGLHETAHHIFYILGAYDRFRNDHEFWKKFPNISKHEKDIFTGNVVESVADVASQLFILSNYHDDNIIAPSKDLYLMSLKIAPSDFENNHSNLHEAESADVSITHLTNRSVDAATVDYENNPKDDMTIVEATRRAIDIVFAQAKEPAFFADIEILHKAAAYWFNARMVVPPTAEGNKIREWDKVITEARAHYCRGYPILAEQRRPPTGKSDPFGR
jgi:hypothetical protein